METEARSPNGGYTVVTKWRWKQGKDPNGDRSKVRTQMEIITTSPNGDRSKVRTQMEIITTSPNGDGSKVPKWRQYQPHQMEMEARLGPKSSKVRTQMESEDGFGKLNVDHEDKRDTMKVES
jgi:hypothetical protein